MLLTHFDPSQRVSSIKTRIKTFVLSIGNHYLMLREYLPLKQGLRPIMFFVLYMLKELREYLPLKQGLRQ